MSAILRGQHRATFMRVLQGLEPKSAVEQYRGKKSGGYELVGDYAQLVALATAGVPSGGAAKIRRQGNGVRGRVAEFVR